MWVKSIKQLKRRDVGLGMGAIALFSGSAWAISHSLYAAAPNLTAAQPTASLGQLPVPDRAALQSQKIAAIAPASPAANAKATNEASPSASLKSGIGINRQGVLRISNLTEFPVRVALLPQKPGSPEFTAYEPPAHWDFDPEEGQAKGLLVGLPNRPSLKVKPGEVLVAFALDGSRRYWGPYVVSATEFPNWEPKGAEWQLILQP